MPIRLSRRFVISLILVLVVTLPGGRLPSAAALAQQAPPPPARGLAHDGFVDMPRLPSASPAALPAPAMDALAAPEYAAWTRLVFQSARNGQDWEIWGARGDGEEQANLSNNGGMDIQPRLNRGATRVVFASNRRGDYEIYAMNADGSGQTPLTDNDVDDTYPAWSADGARIVFQSTGDGQAELYVMNADGSGQARLTYHDDYDGEAAWSPDGTQIAFTRRSGGEYRIWVMNADGSGARQLSNQANSEHPAWSPDGTQIAYDADGEGEGWQEIWLMDAGGSNQREIYRPQAGGTDAWVRSWSPDGRYVAFTYIHWVQYQNSWYWTTAYLVAVDSRNNWSITSLGVTEDDWHPDWQSTDIWAPTSTMTPLPVASRASGFEVRWAGNDAGPAGLASYDVQSRVGAGGAWTPWLTETTATSAVFTGAGGQKVDFRVRARDAAFNLEAWPAANAAGASTGLYSWQLSGRLTDNRGRAIAGATVNIMPSPLWAPQTGPDGSYLAYLSASGDHSIAVDRAGHGPLVAPSVTVDYDRRFDHYLPPAQDLVANGGFEAGASLPTGWTFEGPEEAIAVSADAHTGERALLLGRPCPYPCLSESELITSGLRPDLASDSKRNVYLLWAGQEGSYPVASLAVRSPGGAWSAPETLGLRDNSDAQVGIAIDGRDVLHVVWQGSDGLYYRSRAPGAEWSTEQRLVQGGETVDIAADRLGGVHVVYFAWDAGSGADGVRYLERLPSGVWLNPVILDSGNGDRWPGVAVGPDASVHFIYQEIQHIDQPGGIFHRWRPQGGTIQPAERLWTDFGYSFFRQVLAVATDGTVHAFWNWSGEHYSSRPAGGAWTTPEPLEGTSALAIAVDPLGVPHVAGLSGYGPYSVFYGSRSPDGGWRAPVALGEGGNDGPSLTVDSSGAVHVASFLNSPQQGLYYWTSLIASETYTVTAGQQVTIPPSMHRPTVSANFTSSGDALPLSIQVKDGAATTEVFSATATGAWQLAHADLSPWAGQTVTIVFQLRQEAGETYTQVRVDDVTLGEWPTPVIDSVDPPHADAWTATPIVIHGVNFIATPAVRAGSVDAVGVTWVDEWTLQATVPATLGPGIHDLWVTNPGGAAAVLAGAFRSGKQGFLPLVRR